VQSLRILAFLRKAFPTVWLIGGRQSRSRSQNSGASASEKASDDVMINPLVGRIGLVLICLAPMSPGLVLVASGRKTAPSVTWQQFTSAQVRIGVRDKIGTLRKYTVEFVVIAPDGQYYRTSRRVEGDHWCYVSFPDDFNAWWKRGNYTWKGRVRGRVIAEASFEYRSVPMGGTRVIERLTIPQE